MVPTRENLPAPDNLPAPESVPASDNLPAPENVPAAENVPARLDPRDKIVITMLLVSSFTMILNETILSVALPPIMEDLSLVPTTGQWLTTAFMLTMAVVIPCTGFLIARLTTRQVFFIAMSLFTLGTVMCAVAWGFVPLLLGRVIQAMGTAVITPLMMTTVMNLVPPNLRGTVMGNIAIVMSVAPALGPTISGAILSVAPWRFLFVVVLPIAAIGLILGAKKMVNVGEHTHAHLDILSVLLAAAGFGALVYGLSGIGANAQGATTPLPVVAGIIAVAVVLVTAFVLRQQTLQKRDEALLDLRTFSYRTFAFSVLLMATAMGSMFGMVVLLPIFLQEGLGLPTLQVGLMLLPGGLLMGLAGPLVGRLYDRVGPRPLLIPGLLAVAVGMVIMSFAVVWGSWPLVVVAHLVISSGLAFTFTPVFTASMGALPPHLYSHGSATISAGQQIAGAAGTAVMITIMSTRSGAIVAAGGSELEGLTAGTGAAFVVSAVLAVVAALIATQVRKPEDASAPEVPVAGH